ncbi:MAG: hypothetical protein US85_C0025G0007 [Candidatus Shapirobacteria bacterium GW2011_GWF1_38_23]|nr:MAG: hypothetical protein US85_C0025G0007 [Candidatus Shapirobacteria bacterium GW2011_GWF1_38_23]
MANKIKLVRRINQCPICHKPPYLWFWEEKIERVECMTINCEMSKVGSFSVEQWKLLGKYFNFYNKNKLLHNPLSFLSKLGQVKHG